MVPSWNRFFRGLFSEEFTMFDAANLQNWNSAEALAMLSPYMAGAMRDYFAGGSAASAVSNAATAGRPTAREMEAARREAAAARTPRRPGQREHASRALVPRRRPEATRISFGPANLERRHQRRPRRD